MLKPDDADTQQQQDTDVDTQQAVDNDDQNTSGGGDGDQDADKYFLEVDERTRYRTAEDAVKGFQQAGQRIVNLSGWEKTAKLYGLENPSDVEELLDELLELRQSARTSPTKQQTDNSDAAAAAQRTGQLTEQEQQSLAARQWLQNTLPEVFKGDAGKKLFVEVLGVDPQALVNQARAQEELHFQGLVDTGREHVLGLLRTQGFEGDGAKALAERAERYIAAFIDEDDRRKKAFYRGGAALRQVIEEGLNDYLSGYEPLKTRGAADYQKKKLDSAKKAGKQLPTGQSGGKADESQKVTLSGHGKDHNKAWEVFQRSLRESGADD
ncbi:MAG: hypothetical protein L0Z53_06195 [Acidobacteriales bacterium]|nr:hypothetical protein [Terriglobales bacterium]